MVAWHVFSIKHLLPPMVVSPPILSLEVMTVSMDFHYFFNVLCNLLWHPSIDLCVHSTHSRDEETGPPLVTFVFSSSSSLPSFTAALIFCGWRAGGGLWLPPLSHTLLFRHLHAKNVIFPKRLLRHLFQVPHPTALASGIILSLNTTRNYTLERESRFLNVH